MNRTWAQILGAMLFASCLTACGDDGGGGGDVDGGPDAGSDRVTVVDVEHVQCEADADCDNTVFCDGQERCESGLCVGGAPVDCDDGIDCTVDRCSEAAGACISQARDLDGDGYLDQRCVDADGLSLGDDCDDTDAMRFPGNREVCDDEGHDEDCDLSTYGESDLDMDGFDDAACCNVVGDERHCGTDCNDFSRGQHPDAPEVCDRYDNDCDGEIDEGLTAMGHRDADRDGVGAGPLVPHCPYQGGYADVDGDCDDDDLLVSPGIYELCADGIDNDCDGEIDEAVTPSTWYRDIDGDGFGDAAGGIRAACEVQAGYALYPSDCNDHDAATYPGADERCDGRDNDCGGSADYFPAPGNGEDDDGDGVPDPLCGLARIDCADDDASVYPGAPELCDGLDNDCNGIVDGLVDEVAWYIDGDHDGYGDDAQEPVVSCELLPGRVRLGGDCRDGNPAVHPGQPDGCEQASGTDDDCDGTVDEDEETTAYYLDADGDGVGAGPALLACVAPADYALLLGDCDDADGTRFPGADEQCAVQDGVDNDCDLLVDCADSDCWADPACEGQNGLSLTLPGSYSRVVTRSVDATLSLRDSLGTPVAGVTLTLQASEGAVFSAADPVTDASGEVAAQIRLGVLPGPQVFTVAAPGVRSVSVTIQAQAPAPGTITTVVNIDRAMGAPVAGLPAFATRFDSPSRVSIAGDGSLFFSAYGQWRVFRASPAGVWEVVAGSGSQGHGGDLGDAVDAQLQHPAGVALDEAGGRLYLTDYDRIRVVNMVTGKIDTVPGTVGAAGLHQVHALEDGTLIFMRESAPELMTTVPGSGVVNRLLARDCAQPVSFDNCSGGCGLAIAQDGEGLYIAAGLCGTEVGSATEGLAYAAFERDGAGALVGLAALRHIGGAAAGVPFENLDPGEALGAESVRLPDLKSVVQDASGNVLLSGAGLVGRVDRDTGLLRRLGGGGAAAGEGDYYPFEDSTLAAITGMAFDPDGNLLLVDNGAESVRKVWGVSSPAAAGLELSLNGGGAQVVYPNQHFDPVSVLALNAGLPVAGRSVHYAVEQAAGRIDAPVDITDSLGVALMGGYVGLPVGDYDVVASMLDIDGGLVDSVGTVVSVVDPEVGMVYPLLNSAYGNGGNLDSEIAPLAAPTGVFWGMDFASDGTVYYGANYAVHRVRPDGVVERIAGTGVLGTCSAGPGAFEGDIARDTRICSVTGVRLDEAAGKLYFVEDGPRIRVLDLQTGLIDHFYDLSAHGTVRSLGLDGDGGLWVLDRSNLRVLHVVPDGAGGGMLDAAGGFDLNAPGADCTIDPVVIANCGLGAAGPYDAQLCDVEFQPDGSLTMTGRFCGTATGSNSTGAYNPTHVVAHRAADGTWTHLAGAKLGGDFFEGIDGGALRLSTGQPGWAGFVATDGLGNTYFSQVYQRNQVFVIDAQDKVHAVFGAGSGAPDGDYGPALDAHAGTGANLGKLGIGPDGRLYMAQGNTIRVVRLQ